jgi:2-polyprenyl-3-methyl-5-hydroxy-6-metoxy-1,4-benzoquinol methylase
MRSEWDEPALVEAWARAMGDHGDYWRQTLINPLVIRLGEAVVRGQDPFGVSAFEPLARGLRGDTPATKLDGLAVVDLGCGEGCLGRLLAAHGATYQGLDSSEALLAIARQRATHPGHDGRARFTQVDLETEAPAALPRLDPPSLVTAVVTLDHLAEVGSMLEALGDWLALQPGDVPLLCITLAPERLDQIKALPARPGEVTLKRRAVVESCQREVVLWLRSRRTYERAFRDAGLFVRRCEPLFFHRQHGQVPAEEREDLSRRPVFWAWLLSARRRNPPASAVVWPADSDAAALRTSADGLPGPAGRPAQGRVCDFGPGQVIVRVHNMGGELFAVLSGAATMMDGAQELMAFRAGEVLGDLETPDSTGQCGSFPFDVGAGAEGCRVAIYPEPAAAAVLAHSRDIGSRFFRLLRDRLRLALWHYDIREMVGEYLERGTERLEKRLLHRCARALLWAAAIEGRRRTPLLADEIAFIDPDTIARRFKPGTERIDFGVVIRQLHLLRMIDAFPGAALRKEEETRAGASWDALVTSATALHLLPEGVDGGTRATIRAHAGRLRVAGQLIKDGNRTRQFQEVVDDLARLPVALPDWAARLERWAVYIARAHRFWEDRNPWLIVLRDVPALRRIAVGDAQTIDDTLGARAEYLLSDARRPTWELLTAQAASARRHEYLAILDDFVAADLACQGGLLFSSEGGG